MNNLCITLDVRLCTWVLLCMGKEKGKSSLKKKKEVLGKKEV